MTGYRLELLTYNTNNAQNNIKINFKGIGWWAMIG
jgi:hypothetical protein